MPQSLHTLSAGGAPSLVARARPVRAPAGRWGGVPAEPGRDRRRNPPWRSSRTSLRPARSYGPRDARRRPRGGSRAARATNHSSQRDHTGRSDADGTTSRRLPGTRRNQIRSAAPPDRSRVRRASTLPSRTRTYQRRTPRSPIRPLYSRRRSRQIQPLAPRSRTALATPVPLIAEQPSVRTTSLG